MARSTTLLVTNNHINSGSSSIVANADTLKANAAAPTSNLLLKDRHLRYVCAYTAGDNSAGSIVVNLGGTKTVDCIGLIGYEKSNIFPMPTYVTAYSYNTYPNPTITTCNTTTNGVGGPITKIVTSVAFPSTVKVGMTVNFNMGPSYSFPIGTTVVSIAADRLSLITSSAASNVYTSSPMNGTLIVSDMVEIGTISINASNTDADMLVQLSAPITARYMEFNVSNIFEKFALSSFLAGTSVDLGIAYSAGSSETLIKQVVENVAMDGTPLVTTTGPNRQRYNMQFARVTQTTRDTIYSVIRNNKTVLIAHPMSNKTLDECRLVGNEMTTTHDWSVPNLYTINLSLETLP